MTQKELKEILHYNPSSGIFTRLTTNNTKQKIGEEVGTSTHHSGYRSVTIQHTTYQLHRLAWLYITGKTPLGEIDHINRIRNDNRFNNLREVTKLENMKNVGMFSNNTSGTKGVRLFKRKIKGVEYTTWLAFLKVDGIFVLKKYTKNLEQAITIRKEAELKYGIT